MKKKTFILRINGKKVIEVEASGDPAIMSALEKNWFTDTFGIFYRTKDDIAKMILNGIEVKMQTVFRDKRGKFIKLDDIVTTQTK